MNAILISLCLLCGTPDDDARAILALANAGLLKPATIKLTYDEACQKAISENKPLVVFLDGPRYVQNWTTHVEGVVYCSAESLPGFLGPIVIISVPRNGDLYYLKSLPAWSSAEDILKAIGKGAAPVADTFRPVLAFQSTASNYCPPGG